MQVATDDEELRSLERARLRALVEGDLTTAYGSGAALRYRARLENIVGGQTNHLRWYWHTDIYERHEGQWQAVWSHATEIRG